MDNFPQGLVEQYLKTSHKLKKFERVVFKRFAPNASEVLNDFVHLALKFEEASIYQYAAMCYLGAAKCEKSMGNGINECHSYLKAARAFLKAHALMGEIQLRFNSGEYKEGALRCYWYALERCADDSVLKAAIIREMSPIQPNYEGTSSFASPAHRIYELELAAHSALERKDYLKSLQCLDDIDDNVEERKQRELYKDLLAYGEIQRVLLLLLLNLPPSRQSPSHIKLIEFYYGLANDFGGMDDEGSVTELQLALAEAVLAWSERRNEDFKLMLQEISAGFASINESQRHIINLILENLEGKRGTLATG